MSGTNTIPTQSSKASTAATDDMEITNYNELNVEENLEDQAAADPSKLKKKLTSDVWKEMSRLTDPDGSTKAQCIWCKKKLVSGGKAGTTHLTKHLKVCVARKLRCKGQQQIQHSISNLTGNIELSNFKFDQEKSRRALAKMIIKHNYPFNMCEHELFEKFCNSLNPNIKLVSRNTIRTEVMLVHKEEKMRLYEFLDGLDCRITLTTDIWTSEHANIAYTCLTAHFVDDNWELKKKILAYRHIPYPHDGETLFRFINDLILEWNLDKKLFCMVVDNASSNDSMVRHLKSWLVEKAWLPLGGDLFHVRCSAHILNLIVQDGLAVLGDVILKIRKTCKYLKKSTYASQKFEYALQQCKLKGKKKVALDVQTRWNSTYLMLESALPVKEAFNRLAQIDRNYKFCPSDDEWKVADVIHGCLKIFYDCTNHFSGRNFPTSNVFFPDVCKIQLKLREWENSQHDFLKVMVGPMKQKFEKYWEESCLVLGIAVVLDPRFKMNLVEFYYDAIYGSDAYRYVERVKNVFQDLYIEYGGQVSYVSNNSYPISGGGTSEDDYSAFDEWYKTNKSTTIRMYQKSEIEHYLEELVFPRNEKFNILNWWKENSPKYPIIGKMARDILAVPATTVASESAFSVGGRVVDETRASLLPEMVEALVTTADWIELSPNKKYVFDDNDIVESSSIPSVAFAEKN